MTSPGRIISFVGAAAAVIAALGSAIIWVNTRVSSGVVFFFGACLAVVGVWLFYFLAERALHPRSSGRFWFVYMLCFSGAGLALPAFVFIAIGFGVDKGTLRYIAGYLYVALFLIPLFWLGYKHDKMTHKECSECGERVKARAKVCRFCGSRLPAVKLS